jgi:hypothetical protein
MTEFTTNRLIEVNSRLLFIMGYATSILLEMEQFIPVENKKALSWVIEAIENIVYLNKPLPPMPSP